MSRFRSTVKYTHFRGLTLSCKEWLLIKRFVSVNIKNNLIVYIIDKRFNWASIPGVADNFYYALGMQIFHIEVVIDYA